MTNCGYVYILTNKNHNVLYVGSTIDLGRRCKEHIDKIYTGSFTERYNVQKLVYYKFFDTIEEAVAEEKRIKGGSRKRKLDLINGMNPQWKDLLDQIN